jgi:hypothetical protein
MPDASIELMPAPAPADRHPLGVGDVHDRLVALEQHVQAIKAQISYLFATGAEPTDAPMDD